MRVRNMRPNTIYRREWLLRQLGQWAGAPIVVLSEDTPGCLADRAFPGGHSAGREDHGRDDQGGDRVGAGVLPLAVRERLRDDDPTLRLVTPRTPRRPPRPMPEDAMRAALAGADEPMRAILGLAASPVCERARSRASIGRT